MEQKMTDEQRVALWQQRLEEIAASGMTQKAWCKQNNIAESTLRYWIRKLGHGDSVQQTWLQLPRKNSAGIQNGEITITCPGAEIIISSEADPALRSRLIKAMIGI